MGILVRKMNRVQQLIIVITCIMLVSIPAVSALKGDVKIITDPAGARVILEGNDIGTTPMNVPDLQYGDYTFRLTKAGYEDLKKTVTVQNPSKVLKYTLTPVKGVIRIASTPSGATVSVDGQTADKNTPVTLEVPPGYHVIIITKEGYTKYEEGVTVQAGEEKNINADLEDKFGIVRINSIPTDATVFKNGEQVEKNTPVTLQLNPGEYTIAVGKHQVQIESQKVTLEAGDDKTLNFVLDGPPGSVLENKDGSITVGIDSEPTGAEIFIDDQKSEEKTPAFITLRPGDHQVKLTLAGYQTYDEEIAFPEESPLYWEFHQVATSTDLPDISANSGKVDFAITSVPTGAKISVTGDKGTKTGTAPVTFKVLPGTFTVKATLEGYQDSGKTITVGNTGKETKFELEPEPETETETETDEENTTVLKTISTPPGASVSISGPSGTMTGNTPETFRVIPGTYTVNATLSGYEHYSEVFTVERYGIEVDIRLEESEHPQEPPGPGTVQILSEPTGAKVTLEGQSDGITPYTSGQMEPGTYSCTVSLQGYEDISGTVTVKPDQMTFFTADMINGSWTFTDFYPGE